MAYKSLAKLYYRDPQNYTQIYKNRFVSTESLLPKILCSFCRMQM